ncbi:MAG: trypsin-like peptidase domain-containing protein [Crocinitomicaceae bacterium]|nr:trypsin-like peptidase domain-containing protein [Crocinitomicaceae bacterium]
MNSDQANMELFDAYLFGEMSAEEKSAFENRLKGDEAFAKEFYAHKDFLKKIDEGSEYAAVRSQLRLIHHQPGVGENSFFKSRSFYMSLAAVAGIALLVTVFNPFIKEGNSSVADEDYQFLKNEEPAAATESNYAMDSTVMTEPFESYENSDEGVGYISNQYLKKIIEPPLGTAFMISDDGYFLTSKHLTESYTQLILQNKETSRTFEALVVYEDSLLDFAILKCHPDIADDFSAVPYRFATNKVDLGKEVFTLGYPKNDIVFTKGSVSSETGYKSDTNSFEVSMPANPGNSGAPLFSSDGELIGIVNANNNRKQSVTYVINYFPIAVTLENLSKTDSLHVDLSNNKKLKNKTQIQLIKEFRSYIFEVHQH